MTGRTIGGQFTLAALALLTGGMGRQYRDRDALRAAAVELRARGLTYRDVGEALGVAEEAVRALLG